MSSWWMPPVTGYLCATSGQSGGLFGGTLGQILSDAETTSNTQHAVFISQCLLLVRWIEGTELKFPVLKEITFLVTDFSGQGFWSHTISLLLWDLF